MIKAAPSCPGRACDCRRGRVGDTAIGGVRRGISNGMISGPADRTAPIRRSMSCPNTKTRTKRWSGKRVRPNVRELSAAETTTHFQKCTKTPPNSPPDRLLRCYPLPAAAANAFRVQKCSSQGKPSGDARPLTAPTRRVHWPKSRSGFPILFIAPVVAGSALSWAPGCADRAAIGRDPDAKQVLPFCIYNARLCAGGLVNHQPIPVLKLALAAAQAQMATNGVFRT